jgi:site-specific recombinase XerD
MPNLAKHNPVLGTNNLEAAPRAVFRFLQPNSATMMPQMYASYKPPRLVKTSTRWYIEYWYRIPAEAQDQNNTKDWQRFRVFEDINRYKTEEYANALLKAVSEHLKDGYNPFKWKHKFAREAKEVEAEWSLNHALDRFMEYCRDKGLRKKSIQSYQIVVNFLREYFIKGNKVYEPVTNFSRDDIKHFIGDMRKLKGWGNATTNNYVQFTSTVFNWFVKEDKIAKNPVVGIDQLPVNISHHKYYSDAIAETIKNSMRVADPDLYQFCEFIYYTATRPKSEARLLQVKHILFDRKLLFVPAAISKNKKDDYIPIGDELLKIIEDRNKLPGEYYIFGGKQPRSQNYYASKYKPFKDKMKLGADYTIYSWKHSRAIHLAQAGANPYEIMKLFRHSSLDITMKYLRELGLNISDEINQKTKKF